MHSQSFLKINTILEKMNMILIKAILFLCYFVYSSHGYKILLLTPMPVRSLNILGEGYVRHLLSAGHEITYITVYPLKEKLGQKLRQIDLSRTNIPVLQNDAALNVSYLMHSRKTQENDIDNLQNIAIEVASATFMNEEVQKLLTDENEHFDVVISDLLETEIYSALAEMYSCPMIWAYSMGAQWPALRLFDETTNPAYAADYLSPSENRLQKLWTQIKWLYKKWYITIPKEERLYKTIFKPLFDKRGRNFPEYRDLIYNASLLLANDFIGKGLIPSTPQNVVFVGGYHIDTATEVLPNDIQTRLDNSKYGFIYFSMGSTWKSKDMPKTITEGLLKLFSELKETVIWKYEEELPILPKNVHILKWAPQTSILAHPKCICVITHGGLLTSTEAVHFGVPIIGIPIYFDQFLNIDQAVANGFAIKIDLSFDLPNDLRIAIQSILKEPTYRQKAKEMSTIYHDRLLPPGKVLIHWVEHVIKTKGALHLRSPGILMPWYQKYYIDFTALIFLTLLIIWNRVEKIFLF